MPSPNTKPLRFDLIDLRLYTTIVETGSLSKAAAKMPLALSATSARLKALEQRLDLQLLKRSSQGVSITNAGQLFYEHALRMLKTAQDAQLGMDVLSGKGRQQITVFSNTTGMSTQLPQQLSRFLTENSTVDLCFEQHSSRDVLQAVASGNADIGVVDGGYDKKDLIALLYQHIRLVVIVSKNHPLAQSKSCSFSEWLSQSLVGFDKRSSLQQFIEKMAVLQNIPSQFRASAPSFAAVAQLVSQDIGVAILPEPAAQNFAEKLPLCILELTEPWATRELSICLRPDNHTSMPAIKLAKHLAGIE